MVAVIAFGPHKLAEATVSTVTGATLFDRSTSTMVTTYNPSGTNAVPITVQNGYLYFWAAPGDYDLKISYSNAADKIVRVNLTAAAADNDVEEQGAVGPTGPAGPAGPQGPPGQVVTSGGTIVVGASYTFSQQMPATAWVINHNLGFVPAVTVVDTQGSVITGDVAVVDLNTVRASFAYAFAGTAYLS